MLGGPLVILMPWLFCRSVHTDTFCILRIKTKPYIRCKFRTPNSGIFVCMGNNTAELGFQKATCGVSCDKKLQCDVHTCTVSRSPGPDMHKYGNTKLNLWKKNQSPQNLPKPKIRIFIFCKTRFGYKALRSNPRHTVYKCVRFKSVIYMYSI